MTNSESRKVNHLARILGHDQRADRVETLLGMATDPRPLARAATALDRRVPGNAYFKARLWLRAAELVTGRSEPEVAPARLLVLATELNISERDVRRHLALGRKLAAFERILPELAGALATAPSEIIDFSSRLNGRGPAYLAHAARLLQSDARLSARELHRSWTLRHGGIRDNLDIIKPSDWWAFSRPKWPQETDFPGSIPGEVYANALYYFAPRSGVAVDPMAGSGMMMRVYNDRARWQRDSAFTLDVHLFDLHPRRPIIRKHDARQSLPVAADWIFLDPPYFGQSQRLYDGELAATRDYPTYLRLLREIIAAMSVSLRPSGRLCLFLPKWSGLRSSDPNYDAPADGRILALEAGLTWVDTTFVSRGRQQDSGSATKNAAAKRARRMLSDTCVLQVFEKGGS